MYVCMLFQMILVVEHFEIASSRFMAACTVLFMTLFATYCFQPCP
uniref:Uncharacterized protein n=1 Tax=Rhizophora mucronata TaxID=61149 RepID=A0A2P2NPF0_RHIMU